MEEGILRDLTKKIDIKVVAVEDTQRGPTTSQVLPGDTMMIIEAITTDLTTITTNPPHQIMIGLAKITIAGLKMTDLTTPEALLIGMVLTGKVEIDPKVTDPKVIDLKVIDPRVQFAAITARVKATLLEIAKKRDRREEMVARLEAEVASGEAVMAALKEVALNTTTEIEIEEALMIEEASIPTLEAQDGLISPEDGIRTTRRKLKVEIGMRI